MEKGYKRPDVLQGTLTMIESLLLACSEHHMCSDFAWLPGWRREGRSGGHPRIDLRSVCFSHAIHDEHQVHFSFDGGLVFWI